MGDRQQQLAKRWRQLGLLSDGWAEGCFKAGLVRGNQWGMSACDEEAPGHDRIPFFCGLTTPGRVPTPLCERSHDIYDGRAYTHDPENHLIISAVPASFGRACHVDRDHWRSVLLRKRPGGAVYEQSIQCNDSVTCCLPGLCEAVCYFQALLFLLGCCGSGLLLLVGDGALLFLVAGCLLPLLLILALLFRFWRFIAHGNDRFGSAKERCASIRR